MLVFLNTWNPNTGPKSVVCQANTVEKQAFPIRKNVNISPVAG